MNLYISHNELAVLNGSPHLQQLVYLKALRPYMDFNTGIVGEKRGISYQSISEELYVEPHQGIKGGSPSKDQLRRAIKGLSRSGAIEILSTREKLVVKCLKANIKNSVQNKAAIKPPSLPTSIDAKEMTQNKGLDDYWVNKATIVDGDKGTIPHREDNLYIFLRSQFEKFWSAYPEKKSRENAWLAFAELHPSDHELKIILDAIEQQKSSRALMIKTGSWVPAWKFPANWLRQQCWLDTSEPEIKENNNAKCDSTYSASSNVDCQQSHAQFSCESTKEIFGHELFAEIDDIATRAKALG